MYDLNPYDESSLDENSLSTQESKNPIQAIESDISQENSNNEVTNSELSETGFELTDSDITAGGDVNVTIAYSSNSELPGFNPNKGYQAEPLDIGQFDDAILIADVSFGNRYASFETNEIFINKKKYTSSFHLKPKYMEQTRVGFNLVGSPRTKGIFLQFGLGDLATGTTTLTYLVSIFGDGESLWSGQVKYSESQIVSVVLDVENYQDIIIEYQIVEQGKVSPSQNPLYFTEAKLLFE